MEFFLLITLGILSLLANIMTRRGERSYQNTDDGIAQHTLFSWHRMIPIALLAMIVFILGWVLLRHGTNVKTADLSTSSTIIRTLIVFVCILSLSIIDLRSWTGTTDRSQLFFACTIGTLASFMAIALKRAFFETSIGSDPFLLALGIVLLILVWKFFFGAWNATIKTVVLGTFLFWIIYAILRYQTTPELIATLIATLVAIVPVVIWCTLFLQYHRTQYTHIVLAFFAGMLSTVPILFYSELAERGMTLNFFLFTINPINFHSSAGVFVRESIFQSIRGSGSILLSTFVTYLLVGVLEEVSKGWLLLHSSRAFFRSIDDVLQLSIIVALGFAFAENLANPTYFVGFVKQYLLVPSPDYVSFMANVFGRSVLTIMVHILSTGVMGYFFGKAVFATSEMREQFTEGRAHAMFSIFHKLLALPTDRIYAQCMMTIGLVSGIVLHGLFDAIVTIPEVLPGNPQTIGALLSLPTASSLSSIPLILPVALLYVIGGFWLLTFFFEQESSKKVREE